MSRTFDEWAETTLLEAEKPRLQKLMAEASGTVEGRRLLEYLAEFSDTFRWADGALDEGNCLFLLGEVAERALDTVVAVDGKPEAA